MNTFKPRDEVDVKTYQYKARECTLLKQAEIKEASREELKRLEHLHYKANTPANTTKIYAAYINGELAGAIAYTPPIFACRGRSKAAPEYKPTKPYTEYLKRLNRDFTRIARVIVAPKYRGIGIKRKTREGDDATNRQKIRRNTSGHGEVQPILRKSRHEEDRL
ncbi:MAG: hypothetical protein QXN08_00150 [Nitrososphaerales archaeon]